MIKYFGILSVFILFFSSCRNSEDKGVAGNVDQRVEDLLSQMSVKEKVGQMTQLNLDVLAVGEIYNLSEPHRLDSSKLHKAIVEYAVGSVLNCGGHAYTREHWHELIGGIQETALTKTRLKIPVLYGIDAIHGANYTLGSTLFPQPLAQAAAWNPELVEKGARITAYEVRASGIPWNFSPVLDLGRDPRWSRFFETYGEDVMLSKAMGTACIKGYQGDSLNGKQSVAACMKHFLGYSMPRTGKDRTPVYIDERQLREYFLPTFEEAIKSGAATLMVNSGEINGVPVHASKEILTGLLREELGFEGLVVTDWEDIMKLHNIHKVAPTMKDAVRMAVDAGIDMSMVPNDFEFSDLLLELVEEGTITEARLDESVRRILKLKFDLGLFDNAYPPDIESFDKFNSDEHKEAAMEMAAESITLLKNDSLLPLNPSMRVFLTGPGADNINFQNGAWTRTWQGVDTTWNDTAVVTIAEHLMQKYGEQIKYFNPVGATEYEPLATEIEISKAKQMASNSDVIVVCLAEFPSTEKVGDIDNLSLPEAQRVYVKSLVSTGKPIVLLLGFNRPRIISDIEPLADAVLMLYQPGDYGAIALEKILYGEVNPSGKLPFTWPRTESSLLWYDHKHTERLDQKFGMTAFNPQWEFGYGLSYSTFQYDNLKLNKDTLTFSDTIHVAVEVSNISMKDGKEVVQLYVSDRFASITPAVKLLKGFSKTALEAESSKEIAFHIPVSELAFVSQDLSKIVEEGWFDISIGALSDSLYIKK